MGANAGKTLGYGKAFATSVNRAAGAIKAGNPTLARNQLAAADRYARLLANALNADPGMRANVVSALGASAHNRLSLSAPRVSALKKRIATSGVPIGVARTLGSFGLSRPFIMHLGKAVNAVRNKPISTTLAGLMNAPSVNKGERNVANGLAAVREHALERRPDGCGAVGCRVSADDPRRSADLSLSVPGNRQQPPGRRPRPAVASTRSLLHSRAKRC